MNGRCDWPSSSFGGPYGYYVITILNGGIRLGYDSPTIPIKSYKDIYKALGEEQKKLIAGKPKTLAGAYLITLKGNILKNILFNISWRR